MIRFRKNVDDTLLVTDTVEKYQITHNYFNMKFIPDSPQFKTFLELGILSIIDAPETENVTIAKDEALDIQKKIQEEQRLEAEKNADILKKKLEAEEATKVEKEKKEVEKVAKKKLKNVKVIETDDIMNKISL